MKNKCTEPFPPTISVIAVAVSCGGDEEKPNPLYEYFSLFELSNSEFSQVVNTDEDQKYFHGISGN